MGKPTLKTKGRRPGAKRGAATGYSVKQGTGSRPFLYSEAYNAWRGAVIKGYNEAADEADYQWRRRFAPHTLQSA
jgi:hypothetical protein